MIAINVGEIAVEAGFMEALLTKVLEKFAPDTPVTMTFRKAALRVRTRPERFRRQARHRTRAGDVRAMNDKAQDYRFRRADYLRRSSFPRRDPGGRNEPVVIVEDYGYRGQEGGIPRDEERVILKRPIWSAIADIARREFNDRLKAAKVLTGPVAHGH